MVVWVLSLHKTKKSLHLGVMMAAPTPRSSQGVAAGLKQHPVIVWKLLLGMLGSQRLV